MGRRTRALDRRLRVADDPRKRAAIDAIEREFTK